MQFAADHRRFISASTRAGLLCWRRMRAVLGETIQRIAAVDIGFSESLTGCGVARPLHREAAKCLTPGFAAVRSPK